MTHLFWKYPFAYATATILNEFICRYIELLVDGGFFNADIKHREKEIQCVLQLAHATLTDKGFIVMMKPTHVSRKFFMVKVSFPPTKMRFFLSFFLSFLDV